MSESYQWLDDAALHHLLARRRSNLERLEVQSAIYANGQEPLELYNQREAERDAVEQLLAEQRRRSHPVDVAVATLIMPSSYDERLPVATISNGLVALSELMALAPVRNALVAFRTEFQTVSDQIADLSHYKGMHDLFQQLESFYEQLSQGCKRLLTDETAWADIEAHEPDLHNVADDLLRIAAQVAFGSKESLWMRRLDRARTNLRHAVETSNVEQLRSAVQSIYDDVIDREMSRVNMRLVEAARRLQFDALLHTLDIVRSRLAGITLAPIAALQFATFVNGLGAFQTLEDQLRALVNYHNSFQSLDDELRRVRSNMEIDRTELETAWIDIRPLAEELVAANQPDWSSKLNENCTLLDQALVIGDWNKTRKVFLRYYSHINRSFNKVDGDLLKLCGQLQIIGRPFSVIIELIA